jgi:hypothetical protein
MIILTAIAMTGNAVFTSITMTSVITPRPPTTIGRAFLGAGGFFRIVAPRLFTLGPRKKPRDNFRHGKAFSIGATGRLLNFF